MSNRQKIRVQPNSNGRCINFINSALPAYWNGCLVAEIDPDDTKYIQIRNTFRLGTFEFKKIQWERFEDEEGQEFKDAQDAIDYINANASTKSNTTTIEFVETETIDFTRDNTSTTILVSNGDSWAINSIRAAAETSGTISVYGHIGTTNRIYTGLNPSQVTLESDSVSTDVVNAVNAMNAYFSNSPTGMTVDVPNWIVNSGNSTSVRMDSFSSVPSGRIWKSDSSNPHRGRMWTDETISEPGEYFTFQATGPLFAGAGLYDSANMTRVFASYDIEAERADGYVWSMWGNIQATSLETLGSGAGASNDLVKGLAWVNGTSEQTFKTSTVESVAWLVGNPVTFRIGIDRYGHFAFWYYNSSLLDWIELAHSLVEYTPQTEYGLMIKAANTTTTIVSAPTIYTLATPRRFGYFYILIDGCYYYPLFRTSAEATYYSQNVAGGSSSSAVQVFPEDPSFTTWYSPGTGYNDCVSTAPTSTTDVQYSSIATTGSNSQKPPVFSLSQQTFAESVAVNIPIDVNATNWATSVTGQPSTLLYSNGYLVGTTPILSAQTDYTVYVTRANAFGSTQGTFTLRVTNNASLSTIAGWTTHQGNVFQPNRILSSENAVMDFDTDLQKGRQFRWKHRDNVTLGIFDSSVTTSNKESDDVHGTAANWDLRFHMTSSGLNIGSNYSGIGWASNTAVNSAHPLTGTDEWKLSYVNGGDDDAKMILYLNGSQVAISGSTFAGNQTISLATREDLATEIFVPPIIDEAGTFAGDAISGFTFVADTTTLTDANTLANGSAVDIDETVEAGKRYIFPQTWIEAYVLPALNKAGDRVDIGIVTSGADASDGLEDDWDIRMTWEYKTSTSHTQSLWAKTGVGTITGTNVDSNQHQVVVNSNTDAFYDYAFEVYEDDVYLLACNVNDINTQPAVANGGVFGRSIKVETYTGTIPITMTIYTTNTQMDISASGIQEITIPNPPNWITILEPSAGVYTYDGDSVLPTLNAGTTYRFLVQDTGGNMTSADVLRFTNDGSTEYTTGITRSGTPGTSTAYVEFAIPSDVPVPMYYYWGSSASTDNALTISGSTYQPTAISGFTHLGTSVALVDSNTMANGSVVQLDQTLSAAQRFIIAKEYFDDTINLPNSTWATTDAYIVGVLSGSASSPYTIADFAYAVEISRVSASNSNVYLKYYGGGVLLNTQTVVLASATTAFSTNVGIEIETDGSKVHFLTATDGALTTDDDEDIPSGGNFEYVPASAISGAQTLSFLAIGRSMDFATTNLSIITAPQASPGVTTPVTKAIRLDSNNNRANDEIDSNRHPALNGAFDFACVFRFTASSGSTPRGRLIEAGSSVRFYIWWTESTIQMQWGTSFNNIQFDSGTVFAPNTWHGLYFSYDGGSTGVASGSVADYYSRFRVATVNLSTGAVTWLQGSEDGSTSNSSGMSNDNFGISSNTRTNQVRIRTRNGTLDVAHWVVSSNFNSQYQDNSEVATMVRNPKQWWANCQSTVGYGTTSGSGQIRNSTTTSTGVATTSSDVHQDVRIYLMGDSVGDIFPNIKNHVTGTRDLQLQNMSSSDIVNINISGLT